MITLYQFSTSPFTEKVRRALNYLDIPFEVHEVERAKVAEGVYQDVSPTGKFPALKDGEKAVWDSTDIIYHLETLNNGKSLVPENKRDAGLAHAIEEWADESLYFYEMTMRLTWEHNMEVVLEEFGAMMPDVPKENLKELIKQGVSQLTEAQGVGRKPRDQVTADVERHLGALEGLLADSDWLVGDSISFADLAVIGQLNALLYAQEAKQSLADKVKVQAWMKRLDETAPNN